MKNNTNKDKKILNMLPVTLFFCMLCISAGLCSKNNLPTDQQAARFTKKKRDKQNHNVDQTVDQLYNSVSLSYPIFDPKKGQESILEVFSTNSNTNHSSIRPTYYPLKEVENKKIEEESSKNKYILEHVRDKNSSATIASSTLNKSQENILKRSSIHSHTIHSSVTPSYCLLKEVKNKEIEAKESSKNQHILEDIKHKNSSAALEEFVTTVKKLRKEVIEEANKPYNDQNKEHKKKLTTIGEKYDSLLQELKTYQNQKIEDPKMLRLYKCKLKSIIKGAKKEEVY